ncbi:MAG: DUF3050 domain-containing protein [Fuerstiella sp.]|nr:DUF3050 domain-containing protein [Fuerstiella sp.]
MNSCHSLNERISRLRQCLLQHPAYSLLTCEKTLITFMEFHVFAVWDFMSLLKSLQRELTCVSVPWTPPKNRSAAKLINEIVLAEESDMSAEGNPASHFELYLSAMRAANADTTRIDTLIGTIQGGGFWRDALSVPPTPPSIRNFVDSTFDIIDSGDLCAIAAAFTFGREQLLPDVFEQIVSRLNCENEGRFSSFEYYLQRHIQLDGNEHSHMAEQLMVELCGDDKRNWKSAEDAAEKSLKARLQLWNAISERIQADSSERQLTGRS